MVPIITALIIGCEIAFWLFILAGLVCRYLLHLKKISLVLLACTPVIDVVLLVATFIDLQHGAKASLAHGLAAVYIGVSVAFGHSMIRWADIRFAHRLAGGPAPAKPDRFGAAHARRERRAWMQHLLAWVIGTGLLYAIILWIDDTSRTEQLMNTLQLWSVILGIDAMISFSYTLWPRTPKVNRKQ